MRRIVLLFGVLLIWPRFSIAQDADQLIAASRTLIAEQKWNEALKDLDEARQLQPKNDDIVLLIARVHGWQGQYDLSEEELNGVLQRHPDYKDAADALAWVQKARNAPKPFEWQLDTGGEYSAFSRHPQESWNQQFMQINRFLGDLTLHGNVQRYKEFSHTDMAYEIGGHYRFSPRLNGYLLGSVSPGSIFRPRWRAAGGGAVRLDPEEMKVVPIWATLDARHDIYNGVAVRSVTPGFSVAPAEDWAFSSQLIGVQQLGTDMVFGWFLRLDGRFVSGCRFNLGYADAPETEAGVTVYTRTFFGGIKVDLTPAYTVYLSYTHDDRQNSYIRHVVDAGLSYRF